MTVAEGQWIQVFGSHRCYDGIAIGGTQVDRDGQVIEPNL